MALVRSFLDGTDWIDRCLEPWKKEVGGIEICLYGYRGHLLFFVVHDLFMNLVPSIVKGVEVVKRRKSE